MKVRDPLIEVFEVKDRRPVYERGFKFWIRGGFKLTSDEPLCMHSLLSLAPYCVAFSCDISHKDPGLSTGQGGAHV